MNPLEIEIHSLTDTDRLGQALAATLPAGTTISLIGTLGAGKTRLVQAVAAALGTPREDVTSPTFVLLNEYTSGTRPVYHFDAYRLKDDDEFLNLGPDEYFEGVGLTFVEWGDLVANCLPSNTVRITIEPTDGESRHVTITGLPPEDAAALKASLGQPGA
ncbi:tRNA threonylcarbamoyladenosine biosynthesis protein TsaE [Posidoniimonas corsicana]|uniref:tRNA threonylcarbamoyladenosine biosynthesis protein TsaE n=1 Tax=Posidoniimonas corsicana TaxID=1938618 RepID=A0A5C5VEV2_9BACT|nr:tRNA (adenosine(37)-N6)-threonylcarbamoyltransferase complex ATPase subunit type 1 TsaE [Posidoniimonas corsicana]TWT36429.1 tRNA threonylcarbamoyladenosine biosynthesis protein TsaE [Posidoniimonas corsicana]